MFLDDPLNQRSGAPLHRFKKDDDEDDDDSEVEGVPGVDGDDDGAER